MSNNIWFMGGLMYDADIDNHRAFAVRPSHTDEPYTADTNSEAETLWSLCKHHSHLYSLTKGEEFAILRRESWQASPSVKAENILSGDAIDKVRRMKWGQ